MYRIVDALVVRAATGPPNPPATRWPDLTGGPHSAAHQRRWLQEVWQDGDFPRAVEYASPDLARCVDQICAGQPATDRVVRRTVVSVMRYRLRATTRATPFGLFAGVATARLGTDTTLRLGTAHQTASRPDAAWLEACLNDLQHDNTLKTTLTLLANNLVIDRDGSLLLEYRAHREDGHAPVLTRIRATAPARAALRAAESPIAWRHLAQNLSAAFPSSPRHQIDQLITALVAHRFLLTDLHPALADPDPLASLLTSLHRHHAPQADALREIATALAAHDTRATGPAAARAARSRALTAMARHLPTAKPALAVDTHLDGELVLPAAVAEEATSAAEALVRLAPSGVLNAGWAAWHTQFLDRYGPRAVVPVTDALAALGFPHGYLDSPAPPAATPLTDRDKRLLALAHAATLRRRTEVRLHNADLSRLAASRADPDHPIQPSTEITVRVHATDQAALERGEFTLQLLGVSRAAGATTGRFLPLFDKTRRDRITEQYATLPGLHHGAVLAQISSAPLYTHAHNITRCPPIAPLTIPLGEYRDHDAHCIPLTDLAVAADAHRLHLVSLSRRRPVHTTMPNAVDLTHHTHPLARFLLEAPVALATPCTGFSWGPAASALPVLPALRHGRTILSPARWKLDRHDLPGTPTPHPRWEDAFTAWRRDVLAPDAVLLGEGDQYLGLDLTEPSHRALLRTHLDRDGRALLRPAPTPRDLGWADGRVHEVVIPLAAAEQAAAPVRWWPGAVVDHPAGRPPGDGDQLLLKLYALPDRHHQLLTEHLPTLIQAVKATRWWFVRYRDPAHHLRVRLTLPPADRGTATARIGAWTRQLLEANLIVHASWDTDYPETARFGGAATRAAVEHYFAADSAAALAQLNAAPPPRGPAPEALTAASLLDIALGLTADDTGAIHWLITHAPTTSPAPPRPLYDQALALTEPTADSPLPDGIAARWAQRRDALAAYRAAVERSTRSTPLDPVDVLPDLLHLHHARVSGPDPARERLHLHLAKAAALHRRARPGRRP